MAAPQLVGGSGRRVWDLGGGGDQQPGRADLSRVRARERGRRGATRGDRDHERLPRPRPRRHVQLGVCHRGGEPERPSRGPRPGGGLDPVRPGRHRSPLCRRSDRCRCPGPRRLDIRDHVGREGRGSQHPWRRVEPAPVGSLALLDLGRSRLHAGARRSRHRVALGDREPGVHRGLRCAAATAGIRRWRSTTSSVMESP